MDADSFFTSLALTGRREFGWQLHEALGSKQGFFGSFFFFF